MNDWKWFDAVRFPSLAIANGNRSKNWALLKIDKSEKNELICNEKWAGHQTFNQLGEHRRNVDFDKRIQYEYSWNSWTECKQSARKWMRTKRSKQLWNQSNRAQQVNFQRLSQLKVSVATQTPHRNIQTMWKHRCRGSFI